MADVYAFVGTQALATLPLTAWELIALHLGDSPEHLRMLSGISPALQRECRPFFSAHFEHLHSKSVTLNEVYPWHDALLLCLEGYLDPLFINHFTSRMYRGCDEVVPTTASRPSNEQHLQDSALDGDRLYREAASRFFHGADLEEICHRFSKGNADAAMAVLLPLCKRLKTLEVNPFNDDFHFSSAVVLEAIKKTSASGISSELARRSAKLVADQDLKHINLVRRRFARQDTDAIPFSELLTLWSNAWETFYNAELPGFLPFMCIPSLHRIVLHAMKNQRRVPWPDGLKCHCPEIYFAHSSIGHFTLWNIIDGIGSDCDIKQWFMLTTWEDSTYCVTPEWDHAVIKFNAQGEKIVRISEDYDLGQAGYLYGWVCHLYCQLTGRWDQLDVEQLPMEEAYYNEWLGGPGGLC